MGRGKGGSTSHGKRTAGVVKTSGIGATSAMRAAIEKDGFVVETNDKSYKVSDDLVNKLSRHVGDLSNETIDVLREQIGLDKVNVPSVIREIGKSQPITEKLYRLVAIDLKDGELAEIKDGNLKADAWQKEKYRDLDTNEKVALHEYTDIHSATMNDYLRAINSSLTELAETDEQLKNVPDEMAAQVLQRRRETAVKNLFRHLGDPGRQITRKFITAGMNGLAKLIDAHKDEPPLLVTRGGQLDVIEDNGDVVYEPGFRSTSAMPTDEGPFRNSPMQFVFFTNKGADISDISAHPDEYEILLMPGTAIKQDTMAKRAYDSRLVTGREFDLEKGEAINPSKHKIDAQLERLDHPYVSAAWKRILKQEKLDKGDIDKTIWKLARDNPEFAKEAEDYIAGSRFALDYSLKYLGSKRWDKAENKLLQTRDFETISQYARELRGLGETWQEAEDLILKEGSPREILNYVETALNYRRWEKGEQELLSRKLDKEDFYFVINYARDVYGTRWKELEAKMLQEAPDPGLLSTYAKRMVSSLDDEGWQEAEPIIFGEGTVKDIFDYKDAVKGYSARWDKAEAAALKKSQWDSDEFARMLRYAQNVIGGRWAELEERLIFGNGEPQQLMRYAANVIEDRWEEAEILIRSDISAWNVYIHFLRSHGKTLPDNVENNNP